MQHPMKLACHPHVPCCAGEHGDAPDFGHMDVDADGQMDGHVENDMLRANMPAGPEHDWDGAGAAGTSTGGRSTSKRPVCMAS